MPSTETEQSGRTDAQSRSSTPESASADADADVENAAASAVEEAGEQEPQAARTRAGSRSRAKPDATAAQSRATTTRRARPTAEATGRKTAESQAAAEPPVDLYDAPEELIVVIDLPGYTPDAIDISGADQTLHVTAERSFDETPANTRPVQQERVTAVDRTIDLPSAVDLDAATATCTRGVCRVSLPKAEHARRTQIQVE